MLRSHPHIFNATRVPVQWKKMRRKKKKKIDRNFFSSLLRWFYELDAVRYLQPKKIFSRLHYEMRKIRTSTLTHFLLYIETKAQE
jgi:hypothetical protein